MYGRKLKKKIASFTFSESATVHYPWEVEASINTKTSLSKIFIRSSPGQQVFNRLLLVVNKKTRRRQVYSFFILLFAAIIHEY